MPKPLTLGVGVWAADVPHAVRSEHLLRIWSPVETDASIGAQVSMHTSHFLSAIIPVCKDLTAGAMRFASKRGAWMAVSLKRFVEVFMQRSFCHARLVEHLAKPSNRNQLNGRWTAHA
jgi:hypothetical protein